MKKIFFPVILLFVVSMALSSWIPKSTILPTSMKVSVIDNLGNFVDGAAVTLFHNEDDYKNETNSVSGTKYTNSKGKVTFKKLESKVYYIYAVKGDMTNIGHGVRTDTLRSGNINKVNIVIE